MKKIIFMAMAALVATACGEHDQVIYTSEGWYGDSYCKSGKISVEVTACCKHSEISTSGHSVVDFYLAQKTELDLISDPEKSAQELKQLFKEKQGIDYKNLMIVIKPSERIQKLFCELQESRMALEIAQNYYQVDSLKTAKAKIDAIGYNNEAKALEQMRDNRASVVSEERKQKMRSDAIKQAQPGFGGTIVVNQ